MGYEIKNGIITYADGREENVWSKLGKAYENLLKWFKGEEVQGLRW